MIFQIHYYTEVCGKLCDLYAFVIGRTLLSVPYPRVRYLYCAPNETNTSSPLVLCPTEKLELSII